MAEATLLGVAESVLGQLRSPALKNFFHQECSFNGVWSFEKDLKKLAQTIETINLVIHDAEQRQSSERIVKLWLSRLKGVLYEADDLFDAIAARALRKKVMDGMTFKKKVTLFFSKSNHLGFFYRTVLAIKDIKEHLDVIKDDMPHFQFALNRIEWERPHRVLEREERHSFVDRSKVFGRDQEKEDIIGLLLSEGDRQRNVEVISVIGFGGLGKTTLAQLVFNDENVQNGFDICLWACINYFFDLESVLVKILSYALNDSPEGLHLDQLQSSLREQIQGKKYLLVLDDVWDANTSNWGRLETILMFGNIGSKVLITTRKVKVARSLDALEPFYRLGTLSKECAWSLFVEMTFVRGEFVGDSELELIGKQIVHKCGCVPLLVSVVGRMLRQRRKEKDVWLSFLDKEFDEISAGDMDDGNMMHVLKVSYDDLPLALKRCFAYCSIFPKDYVIEKDELIHMWMAQGFIEPHVEKSLEEVGDDYFFYLVDDCFFQEVKKDESNFGVNRYTCKMHNFIRDLAIQVAESTSIFIRDRDCRDMVEKSGTLYHIM